MKNLVELWPRVMNDNDKLWGWNRDTIEADKRKTQLEEADVYRKNIKTAEIIVIGCQTFERKLESSITL